MIIKLPFNIWIEARYPYRQHLLMRSPCEELFHLTDSPGDELVRIVPEGYEESDVVWYKDKDQRYYRSLISESGRPASIDDLEKADTEKLYGHYLRRSWWRDHPSSVDLALESDVWFASAPTVGAPETPFSAAKARVLRERPEALVSVKARVQRRLNQLWNTKHGILVRSPLPGYVVQKAEGEVSIQPWLPPVQEGTGTVRVFFNSDRHGDALRCAELLNINDEALYESFDDEDLDAALGLATKHSNPKSYPSPPNSEGDTYLWHPIRSTMAAVYAAIGAKVRQGANIPEVPPNAEGFSGEIVRWDSTFLVPQLRHLGPVAGFSESVIELAIKSAMDGL